MSEIVKNLPSYDKLQIVKKDGSFIKPRHKAALYNEIINGKNPLIEKNLELLNSNGKPLLFF